jgi:hypothetical protein
MLLRERYMQPSSGQKKELDHFDVGRQFIRTHGLGIGEIGISAEQAFDNRLDETALQQVGRLWFFQRQRGKEGQADGAIGDGARVQRVDDVIRLAEPERQSDDQIGPDLANDIFRNRFGVGKQFRRHVQPRAIRFLVPGIGPRRELSACLADIRLGDPWRRRRIMGFPQAAVCLWGHRPLNR